MSFKIYVENLGQL